MRNKNISILLLALLLFFSSSLSATSYKLSPELKLQGEEIQSLIFANNSLTYFITKPNKTKQRSLISINKKGEIQNKLLLDPAVLKFHLDTFLFHQKSELIFAASYLNSSTERHNALLVSINKDNLEVSSKKTIPASADLKPPYLKWWKQSQDKRHFAFIYQVFTKKQNTLRLKATIIRSSDFKTVAKRGIYLKDAKDITRIRSVQLTNNKEIGILYHQKSSQREGFNLAITDSKEKKSHTFEIEVEESKALNADISESTNGILFIAGVYVENKKSQFGFFSKPINSISFKSYKVKTQLLPKHPITNNDELKKLNYHFSIKAETDNLGGFLISCAAKTSLKLKENLFQHITNNLNLAYVNAKGKFEWVDVIPLVQIGENSSSGYRTFYTNNIFQIVFLENKSNFKKVKGSPVDQSLLNIPHANHLVLVDCSLNGSRTKKLLTAEQPFPSMSHMLLAGNNLISIGAEANNKPIILFYPIKSK